MTMGNVTHGRSVQLSPTALLHCLPMSQVVANPEPQQRLVQHKDTLVTTPRRLYSTIL